LVVNGIKKETYIICRLRFLPPRSIFIPNRWPFNICPKGHNGVAIIQNFFELQYAINRGMLFGLGQGISTALLVGLCRCCRRGYDLFYNKNSLPLQVTHVAFAWFLRAQSATAFDRIHLGYVVDFILWRVLTKHIWPNFNFADVYITVGVGLLVRADAFFKRRSVWRYGEKDGKENQKK
jgi:lipoprotein signal peptidase